MKPAARGFSTRLRGVRRRCIHDPRSMHFVAGYGHERCIKSGGLSSRSVLSAVIDGEGIRTELTQLVEIDEIAPLCIRRVMNEPSNQPQAHR